MSLPIIEQPIYGQIQLDTTAWSTPFSWVNRTADIVGTVSYSEGGRLGVPGSSQVDVGTLTVTFKNLSSVPNVGDLIRIRRQGTGFFIFTGYIHDVSQRIVFDDSVSYNTPIVLTTLYAYDWVGYISQFQAVGAGGADPTTGTQETDSNYEWPWRVAALNKIIDPSFSTVMIFGVNTDTTLNMGDTDYVGTLSEHLDLIANSCSTFWYGAHILPSNKTTGRTALVEMRSLSNGALSTGKTFTDVAGSAGDLHYTEIDFQNSSQNVSNSVVVNNRTRFWVPDFEVTKIGGFNEENYLIVNNTQVSGIGIDGVQRKTSTSSIDTYGIRQTEVQTNVAMPTPLLTADGGTFGTHNLITNPSVEYDDDGYSSSVSTVAVRRRKPLDDATPFASFNGLWAMRARIKASSTPSSFQIVYSGGESDGIPVGQPWKYYASVSVARSVGSASDTQARVMIDFLDDSETVISAAIGPWVSLPNTNQWYRIEVDLPTSVGIVRAVIRIAYRRSGGGNFSAGQRYWADGLLFTRQNSDEYFDGDTPWTNDYCYFWTGGVSSSPSYKTFNRIDDAADAIIAKYASTSMRATRIRWNAQEDITSAPSLVVGKTISLTYKGTTTTYRIVGIDGNISPDRYIIDYYLAKV